MDNEFDNETNDAILAIAKAINRLGNADASTPMGGLEALGEVIERVIGGPCKAALTSSVDDAGGAIERGLETLALSVDKVAIQIGELAIAIKSIGNPYAK